MQRALTGLMYARQHRAQGVYMHDRNPRLSRGMIMQVQRMSLADMGPALLPLDVRASRRYRELQGGHTS